MALHISKFYIHKYGKPTDHFTKGLEHLWIDLATQSVLRGPAALASPGSWMEMQNPGH